MGQRAGGLVIALFIGIAMLSSMGSSAVRTQQGEETLEWGEQAIIELDLGPKTTRIGCGVITTYDYPVDVCIFSDDEFQWSVDGVNGTIRFLPERSILQTNDTSIVMDVVYGMSYYLVVDNSEVGGAPEEWARGPVHFTYSIFMQSISTEDGNDDREMNILEKIGTVIMTLGVILLIFAYYSWKIHGYVRIFNKLIGTSSKAPLQGEHPQGGTHGPNYHEPPRPPPPPFR